MPVKFTDLDLQTMALTVWAEARAETREGQKAVAWVIRNRYHNPGWWSRDCRDGLPDDTIAAVCRDPYQFSCWNPNDPNRARLDNPKTRERTDYLAILDVCAVALLAFDDPDPTQGADHYCTKAVAPFTRWAKGRKPVRVIGNHQFYRIGLGGMG